MSDPRDIVLSLGVHFSCVFVKSGATQGPNPSAGNVFKKNKIRPVIGG